MATRREFLKVTGIAGAGLILYSKFGAQRAWAFAQSPGLRKFRDLAGTPIPFRGLGPGGIPVAVPDGTAAPVTGAVHYTMDIRQFADQLHPDLPNRTTLWGFNPAKALGIGGAVTPAHLGGVIVAPRGTPIQITFRNNLPTVAIIPADATLPGANQAANRASVHPHCMETRKGMGRCLILRWCPSFLATLCSPMARRFSGQVQFPVANLNC